MSEHGVTVTWRRTSVSFDYEVYNREYSWLFYGCAQKGLPACGGVT